MRCSSATQPALSLYLCFLGGREGGGRGGGAGYSMKTKTLICEELAMGVCFQLLTPGRLLGCLLLGQWSRVAMKPHTPGQVVFLLQTETPRSGRGVETFLPTERRGVHTHH